LGSESAGGRRSDLQALGVLVDPVRWSLYEHVAAQPAPVTREDAATALGIGVPLAAFHLEKLLRAGLLEAAQPPPAPRRDTRGRPSKLYRRRARAIEVAIPARSYGLLGRIFARALKRRWRVLHGPVLRTARETGRDEARALRLGRTRKRDTSARLERALRTLGYDPVREGKVFRLRNCPFDALARESREPVCSVNLAFLEGVVAVVGRDARARPDPERREGWCCVAVHVSRA
jgi:predicted ArsR family transcriptional regulator